MFSIPLQDITKLKPTEILNTYNVMTKCRTSRKFRWIPDPGTWPLLPGRIRVFYIWLVTLLLFVTFCMIHTPLLLC